MPTPDENEDRRQSETSTAFSDPETFCEEIEAYITQKPLQSLGIALLAGIIVGKIIL